MIFQWCLYDNIGLILYVYWFNHIILHLRGHLKSVTTFSRQPSAKHDWYMVTVLEKSPWLGQPVHFVCCILGVWSTGNGDLHYEVDGYCHTPSLMAPSIPWCIALTSWKQWLLQTVFYIDMGGSWISVTFIYHVYVECCDFALINVTYFLHSCTEI